MFVYLDETGDTGFKFNKGSSRFFVVTILLTTDPLPLNSAIDEFRRSNHFGDWHEFKFYSSPDSVRERFLRIMLRHEGLIRCLVIDKHLLMQPHMRQPDIFYNYLLKMLLVYNNNRLNDATLILDEREKGKKSKQGLGTYLRREINRGGQQKITDIKYHQSHRDNLLQAVDMASGAINAHYAKDNPYFLNIIRPKIDDIRLFTPYMTQ